MGKSRMSVLTPEQALGFLENFQMMIAGRDSPSRPISIRIPENILEAYKTIAQNEQRPYQSMMIEALRRYLLSYNK